MNFCDSRYGREEYIYGKEPDHFFKEVIDGTTPVDFTREKQKLSAEGEKP
jgi:hypothetical protein